MRNYVLIFILSIVIPAVTLECVSVDTFAAETYRVFQLTNNDVDDFDPQLNNNGYLLWSTHSGSGRESYLYDGSKTFKLPFVSGESNLILNNNNKILFNKQDDTNAGVYLFNINYQTTTKIADNGLVEVVKFLVEIG